VIVKSLTVNWLVTAALIISRAFSRAVMVCASSPVNDPAPTPLKYSSVKSLVYLLPPWNKSSATESTKIPISRMHLAGSGFTKPGC
jgi:hypothetical protein